MTFEDGVMPEAVVVSASGRVDALSSGLLEGHCKQLMATHGRKSLVLDLEGVEYMSSAGLRAILSLGKQAEAGGGRLALCGVRGTVHEIFEIAGFLSLFPIADSMEQALKKVAAKR